MTERDVITALRMCACTDEYEDRICAECPYWETCQHEIGIAGLLTLAADTIERLINNAE
jgi:hypothetical protein